MSMYCSCDEASCIALGIGREAVHLKHAWITSREQVLQVIGVKGPLPPLDGVNKTHAMEITPPSDLGWHHQSVAFIVL